MMTITLGEKSFEIDPLSIEKVEAKTVKAKIVDGYVDANNNHYDGGCELQFPIRCLPPGLAALVRNKRGSASIN
jgi:hypothetical protein